MLGSCEESSLSAVEGPTLCHHSVVCQVKCQSYRLYTFYSVCYFYACMHYPWGVVQGVALVLSCVEQLVQRRWGNPNEMFRFFVCIYFYFTFEIVFLCCFFVVKSQFSSCKVRDCVAGDALSAEQSLRSTRSSSWQISFLSFFFDGQGQEPIRLFKCSASNKRWLHFMRSP